ncbi:pentapeptide repeat-containing protein [Nonomuraea fuscirosea]|uniref:pentapeptide repeat-containing protein n=1 Tax=Nonomuraea fuscirosea TaxID=1291556 RepID=UPI0033EAEDE8
MALLVGAAVWGISTWLLQDLDKLPTLTEQVSARIEAVRTALAAGVGAAVTLLLAVRRQRHQELATAHTTHDAAERRTTELYARAVEQLGSDRAPVRLGALYALERLAEHTPALRQRVVDVICAYLRMPFTPPAEQDRREEIRDAQRAARTRARAAQRATHAGTTRPAADRSRDPHEEHQVRLTAQRILEDHLRHQDSSVHRWWQRRTTDPNPRHWAGIRLDLTGATLSGVRLNNCRIGEAWFVGATFTDMASFGMTTFSGEAQFEGATFTDGAWFGGATFTNTAGFDKTTFTGPAWFDRTTFKGFTTFYRATFSDRAAFVEAAFSDEAEEEPEFVEATFTHCALFDNATGLERAKLNDARVALASEGIERVWPPCWRVEQAVNGWQTLSLAAGMEGTSAEEGIGAADGGAGSAPGG